MYHTIIRMDNCTIQLSVWKKNCRRDVYVWAILADAHGVILIDACRRPHVGGDTHFKPIHGCERHAHAYYARVSSTAAYDSLLKRTLHCADGVTYHVTPSVQCSGLFKNISLYGMGFRIRSTAVQYTAPTSPPLFH